MAWDGDLPHNRNKFDWDKAIKNIMEKTETTKRPTAAERLAIFMHYPGQPLYLKGKRPGEFIRGPAEAYYTDEHEHFGTKISFCGYTSYAAHLSIEVKPLSKISEEDAIDLSIAVHGFSNKAIEENGGRLALVGNGRHLAKFAGEPRFMGVTISFHGADFLRRRGYALPYGKWSVEELVEFGIFKLVD